MNESTQSAPLTPAERAVISEYLCLIQEFGKSPQAIACARVVFRRVNSILRGDKLAHFTDEQIAATMFVLVGGGIASKRAPDPPAGTGDTRSTPAPPAESGEVGSEESWLRDTGSQPVPVAPAGHCRHCHHEPHGPICQHPLGNGICGCLKFDEVRFEEVA